MSIATTPDVQETVESIRSLVRTFCDEKVRPTARERDRDEEGHAVGELGGDDRADAVAGDGEVALVQQRVVEAADQYEVGGYALV
jgi:hypothetical protein